MIIMPLNRLGRSVRKNNMQKHNILGIGLLWFSAIVFIAYGLFGFFNPNIPADFSGLQMINGNGYADIGAMYGGLQIGIGFFCLLSALRNDFYKAGLALLTITIGCLALGRLFNAVATTDALSIYTYGALIYEFITALLAAMVLRFHTKP